jgi:hypothetical protein
MAVGLASHRIAGASLLMFEVKRDRASAGPPVDVLLLGDSTAVAALETREIERALGGAQVYNFALPATGPSGGEAILRRYLRTHAPPRLVVLGFTPWALLDRRDLFEGFVMPVLLGPSDAVRAAWRDRRLGYVLSWLADRWPTYRYRDDLRSGALSLLLDAVPDAKPRASALLGYAKDPTSQYAFRFFYTARAERNAQFLAELERDGGWHYWRETAFPGERLQEDFDFAVRDPAFVPSPRETAALDALLDSCASAGIPVLMVPMPQPQGRLRAMAARGDFERFEAFWRDVAGRHPNLRRPGQLVKPAPHAWFADNTHLNPEGASLYTQAVLPLLSTVYDKVSRGR